MGLGLSDSHDALLRGGLDRRSSLSLIPRQQRLLQRRQADGFDSRLEAIRFLPAVYDEGLVSGDVLHRGEEAGLQDGGETALDLDCPGFPGTEFQDQVHLRAGVGAVKIGLRPFKRTGNLPG